MFFTAILYYFILKIFDGEKLKDIINYFQIVLSVVLALGYQIIPRVFDFTSVNVNFKIKMVELFSSTSVVWSAI